MAFSHPKVIRLGALLFPVALLGCASHSAHVANSGDAGPANVCGNGKVESGEVCDGTNLNGASCMSLGFDSGQLQCAPSCKFDTGQCVGSVALTVNASRTTCAAPCAVFFDATATTGLQNGDYVGAHFNWDFDSTNVDPGNVHRSTIGFLSAHVFDVPGTYQVSVRVRDLAGHAGTTTVPITVAALTGSTFYVSSSKGNDSNSGTMAQPFKTMAAAVKHLAAQTTLLLKRGDTFDLGTATLYLPTTTPYLIGAYTDPSSTSSQAPILTSSVPTSGFGSFISIQGVKDIRLVGLHLVASAGAFAGIFMTGTQHILSEGLEVEGIGEPSGTGANTFQMGSSTDGTFIVDSHLHDFHGYGVYGDRSTHFAVIGTTIEKFNGGDHGIRIQGGNVGTPGFANDSYVAENMINPDPQSDASFDTTAFRGDDTNVVEVDNKMQRVISFTPQNDSQLEHVSNVLVEGNVLSDSTVPANTYYNAISIRAQHVVVRNNVIWNPAVAVEVAGHPLLPASFVDQISIYNNTVFVLPPSGVPTGSAIYFLTHSGTTGNVTLENNIFSEGMTSSASSYIMSDGMGTETEDHNLGFAPNVSGSWKGAPTGTGDVVADPLFVSTDISNSQALRLSPGSPAVDVGTPTAAYQDLTGLVRPQGAGWDMGAFELVPSSATPDASAGTNSNSGTVAAIHGKAASPARHPTDR